MHRTSARNVPLDKVIMEATGCRRVACGCEGIGRHCDVPCQISSRHLCECHRSGLRSAGSARPQGRSGPSGTARSARGHRPPRTAGAARTSGRARATGTARSCVTNTDHSGELRAPVLHHPVRTGRSARDCLLRRQKEVSNLSY